MSSFVTSLAGTTADLAHPQSLLTCTSFLTLGSFLFPSRRPRPPIARSLSVWLTQMTQLLMWVLSAWMSLRLFKVWGSGVRCLSR